jgi:integrase
MGEPYGGIVEYLALTGQRRQEVAQMQWEEVDFTQGLWTIPNVRTKNKKLHFVQLSIQALAVLKRQTQNGPFVFSVLGQRPFQVFSNAKRELDQLTGITEWRIHDLRRTCVSGMARLGVAPHVADKILNHQTGTIAGVAAVYQRHDFFEERRAALELWGAHLGQLLGEIPHQHNLRIVA